MIQRRVAPQRRQPALVRLQESQSRHLPDLRGPSRASQFHLLQARLAAVVQVQVPEHAQADTPAALLEPVAALAPAAQDQVLVALQAEAAEAVQVAVAVQVVRPDVVRRSVGVSAVATVKNSNQ